MMSLRKNIPLFFLPLFFFILTPSIQAAFSEKGTAISSDPRATQAALSVLEQGGNAIDAAVAAQWMMQVVEPHVSGLGGSGYLLFYDIGTKRVLFFDGGVKAPEEVTPDLFLDEQKKLRPYQPDRNTGGLPVGTPGLLRLLEEVQSRYGTRKFAFAKLFESAIQAAEAGVEVSEELADAISENQKRLALFPETSGLFLKEGKPLQTGKRLLQPDLAKTFRLIQKSGIRAFYQDAIAKAMVQEVQKNTFRPGLLSYRDLGNYKIAKRDPLHGTYLGHEIFTVGPPATGGVMLLRGLNLLSHFGLAGFGSNAETYHLLQESQRRALAQRSFIGDPDLFEPKLDELLSEAWAQETAESIRPNQVSKKDQAATQPDVSAKFSSVMVADAQGNVVVLSSTLGDLFGSAAMVPGYGFFLNNQLVDFDAGPEYEKTPDAVNVPSPGQRPRHALASAMVFDQGKPLAVFNGYGPNDPAAVLLNLFVSKFDFNQPCTQAIQAPRILAAGEILREEPGLYANETMRVKLELMGHRIEKTEKIGRAQMVCFDDTSGKIKAVGDPRG